MNEKFRELVKKAGGISHDEDGNELAPMLVGHQLEKFAELLFQECVDAVENTPTHCAYTTFQLEIVECTIDKSVETLYNHFNKQRTYKVEAPL